MRILWVCNIMLPAFATSHGLASSNREGWLTGCYDKIVANGRKKTEISEMKLAVCFPVDDEELSNKAEVSADGIYFYGFMENLDTPEIYDCSLEKRFKEITDDFSPDIVHIFGTEFPHSAAMIKSFGHPERVLLGIQGLCSVIADKYLEGLPETVCNNASFRDILKKDSLKQQRDKFVARGINETRAIQGAGNITGRTSFDRNVTAGINPKAKYYKMNETLRSVFYDGRWSIESCVPHSIFVTQGDYPIKGFHNMLLSMKRILERYPDAHLYVAGNSLVGNIDRRSVTPSDGESEYNSPRYPLFLRISEYGKYILHIIRKYDLNDKVTFLGKLTAVQMKEQYLRCESYVCPSLIENSPNSLGEAMLLGVPCAAAETGGIPDMIAGGRDGILFGCNDPDDIARAVTELWENQQKAIEYGRSASKHAHITHDPDQNYERLMEIYGTIMSEAGKEI